MTIQTEVQKRFGLRDGQFFAEFRYKNLVWFLDGVQEGYGDLRDDDIIRISDNLADGEEFVGFNEHHGTEWQQTKTPMIRITNKNVKFRDEIVAEEGM